MPRTLVIGINSFVGKHLVPALLSRGQQVVGSGRTAAQPDVPGVELRHGDLLDQQAIARLVAEYAPATVVNLAGATATAEPHAMYELHVRGTLNLLGAVKEHAPDASIVLLGSAAEYGAVPPEQLPVDERCTPRPNSFFGASKLAQTECAMAAAATWRLRVTVLRPFNILGPELPAHYMPAAFARRLLASLADDAQEPISLVNGHATRDFVDVRDVAQAICLCTEQPPQAGQGRIFNVASGNEVRIAEIARHLCQLAGGVELNEQGTADSRSNINRSCGSAEQLRSAMGWNATIDWRQSLHDMWNALQSIGQSIAC